jgi:hypothetical protein
MMLAGLGCPAIAIVRHHLYDIDILINRTLVYVTLTATLVYFGGVAGLQRLLSPVMGEGNGLAVVASTLLINVVRETTQPAHVSSWLRRETSSKGEQPA